MREVNLLCSTTSTLDIFEKKNHEDVQNQDQVMRHLSLLLQMLTIFKPRRGKKSTVLQEKF